MLRGLLFVLLAAGLAAARNGEEPLNHYGIVALTDSAVGVRLAARFKAKGQPVFLVHDINIGLSRNDIMRFPDRVVLVDDDVWATLRAEGALAKIRASPVVRVQGLATASSWTQRAGLVGDARQRKAFQLGAEILRILEENFGGSPHANQLTLSFDQGRLTLLASAAMMDQLKLSPVRRIDPEGRPRIISVPPDSLRFVRQPFDFRVWAVDPGNPAGALSYTLRGAIPPGLAWDAARHALSGTPTAPGRWGLTAVVRNAEGKSDSLPFVVHFRANEPPEALSPTRITASTGREWTFAPRPRDPDHPGNSLRIVPETLPRRMSYDANAGLFRWRPDSAQVGRRHRFAFAVEDPLGARRSYAYELRVTSDESVVLTEGVKIDLPSDTLVRGRTYIWRTEAMRAAWAGQDIHLEAVSGSDSTRFGNDTLFLRPGQPGLHRLDFAFIVQGQPVAQSIMIPVRDDTPPVFLTHAGDWKVRLGEPAREYHPIAMDPEGERVTLDAEFPAGNGMEWDGRRLRFEPARPGRYPVRFVARDEGGKAAEQWVAYEARKEPVGTRWILESHNQGDYAALTATRDFGTGRVGIYSPNFRGTLLPDRHWIASETPFIFLGGNLLGPKSAARGSALWGDVGFNFSNPPAPFFFTGGTYLRLNGEWRFPESPLSWIEAEFRTHIHQALFAASQKNVEGLTDTSESLDLDSLSEGSLGRTVRNAFRPDNMRAFARVEALGPVGFGFHLGPSTWREDVPMRRRYIQWVGGTVRYRLERHPDTYQASFRAGWSAGNVDSKGSGWSWYASLRASLGSAP